MAPHYDWDRDRPTTALEFFDVIRAMPIDDEETESLASIITLDYAEAMRHLLDPKADETETVAEYDFPIDFADPEEEPSLSFGVAGWN
jgi:hypothetical protein